MTAASRAVRRLAVPAACALLAVLLTACSSSGSGSAIPSFTAAAGKFRVVPHPSSGAPSPQVLAFRGHRVLASLSQVTGSGRSARAQLVLQVTDEQAIVPTRRYRAGDTVHVGSVQVRVDGVYGSGEKDVAVDLTLS